MKKIFSKKTVAITAVTIFMVSLFAWGLVVGNSSDSTTTEIEVQSVFSLEVSPPGINFNNDTIGGTGDTIETIKGGDDNIYADNTVTATVTSQAYDYNLNITSTNMDYDHATITHHIPANNISISGDKVTGWSQGELIFEEETSTGAEGEGFLIDLRVDEVPADVYTGTYAGEITFDLTTAN